MMNDDTAPWAVPFEGIYLDGIGQLSDYIKLPADSLLHAGPPYANVNEIPQPVLHAAAQVLMIDGEAESLEQGIQLITNGHVKLKPAQSHGVVTPLAQVVSSHSWVFRVSDGQQAVYAPLVESAPPAVRFGSGSQATREALMALAAIVAELKPCLREGGIPIAPLITAGLQGGDECHAVTAATHQALLGALTNPPPSLLNHGGFVLPIIMAASAVALRRAGTIHAVGCNGVNIGWQSAAQPVWHQQIAPVPSGEVFSGNTACVLRAIGDSAVIDFAGLGAQALAWSPQMQSVWQNHRPELIAHQRSQLIDPHSGLVCVNPIVLGQVPPRVHLAMVDASGSGNILGRGVIDVDPNLFSMCANSEAWAMMPWP